MSGLSAPPFEVPLATTWLGHPLLFCTEVDSTNRQLRQLHEERALPTGAVLLADYQSGGRGRRGRQWHAPGGSSLLWSALLRPVARERLALLPIVVAVALAEGVESHLTLAPRLKWPNDLLLEGKKCGGVLVESVLLGSDQAELIVGVGLNVNQDASALAELPHATSLRLSHGAAVARGPLLATLLATLERRLDAFQAGWQPHTAWRARAVALGQGIMVHPKAGDPWPATLLDLHDDGRLKVEDAMGRQRLLDAEEVSIVR